MNTRSLMTVLAVLALFVLGLSYVLIAVVQFDPFSRPMRMTVDLGRSGGLLDHSQVTYRGYPVGKVDGIALRPGGVRVAISVAEGTRIPKDTEVAVADLSAAGEQFLDFRPRTDSGPFLADGARIDQRSTRTPVPFSQVVTSASTLVGQLDPGQVSSAVDELQHAFGASGPDIQRVLDGGDFLLAGLEGVLPQTVDTLHNGRTVLGTVSDLRGQLGEFSSSARDLTGTLRKADPALRELVDDSPATLALINDVVHQDGPTVAQLLGSLGTVTQVVADRRPAVGQFLPGLMKLGPTAAAVVKGNHLQTLADLYPRAGCDYGTPRRPPTVGGSPAPRIYRYCAQTGPRLQQRGSTNVPRPDGDHTAGPPPGADPEARARPLPEHGDR